MKNLFSIVLFVQLIALNSCSKIDPALVTEMNDTIAFMQAQTADFDANTQGIVSFETLVNAAPEGLTADTTSGYQALHEKVTALRIKQESTVIEFKQLLAELQIASTDYAAGKINTEQARSQQQTLNGRLVAIKELLGRVAELNDEAQTEYGKMMAEYRSKTE